MKLFSLKLNTVTYIYMLLLISPSLFSFNSAFSNIEFKLYRELMPLSMLSSREGIPSICGAFDFDCLLYPRSLGIRVGTFIFFLRGGMDHIKSHHMSSSVWPS